MVSKRLAVAQTGHLELLHRGCQRCRLDDVVVGFTRQQLPDSIASKFLLHLIADFHQFDEMFDEAGHHESLTTSVVLAECTDGPHLLRDVVWKAEAGRWEVGRRRMVLGVHQRDAHQPDEFSGYAGRHVEVVQLAIKRDVDVEEKGEQNDADLVLCRIAVVRQHPLGTVPTQGLPVGRRLGAVVQDGQRVNHEDGLHLQQTNRHLQSAMFI